MGVKIYMVVGCPCSGKSWVCDQLKDRFEYVRHDDYIAGKNGDAAYIAAIKVRAVTAQKPLLIETPFSMSQLEGPLAGHGFEVKPVFIQEAPGVIEDRYREREGKPIPPGHLARQRTYMQRATDRGAFWGTSSAVLEHLKNIGGVKMPWE